MPTRADHQEQAQRNARFRASIPAEYPEWELTALFYTALHSLLAYLTQYPQRYGPDLRYDMLRYHLEQLGEAEMAGHFRHLQRISYGARYECRGTGWAYGRMTDAERALERIQTRLGGLGVGVLEG